MSPLDRNIPNLTGDGEGSVQVHQDETAKIEVQKYSAFTARVALASQPPRQTSRRPFPKWESACCKLAVIPSMTAHSH